MFRGTIAVHCEKQTKLINTFCMRNVETLSVEPGGTHVYLTLCCKELEQQIVPLQCYLFTFSDSTCLIES